MPRILLSSLYVQQLLVLLLLLTLMSSPGGQSSLMNSLRPTASASKTLAADDLIADGATPCTSSAFAGALSFKLLNQPRGAAVADFNGDSKPDIVTPADTSNKIVVMFGNGAGGFSPATTFGTQGFAVSVAVGDFNGDNKVDIVAANAFPASLAIFIGNGTGGFAAAITMAMDSTPSFLMVADFNRDQKADLVVTQSNGGIAIMLGDGAGGFTTTSLAGSSPYLTSGDFNLDGSLDIAGAAAGQVSIFSGDGLGGFGEPQSFTATSQPTSLASADFNNDGKVDLAVTDFANKIVVLLNNGDGTFGAPTPYAVLGQTPVNSVVVGDFDNDGNIDFAGASVFFVSVWFGDGTGSFARQANYRVGLGQTYLSTNDFNGDGSSDLIAVGYSGATFVLLTNDGTGNFISAPQYAVGAFPNSVLKADFNNDGKLDLATANRDSNDVSILLGNGTGVFAAAKNFSVGPPPQSFAGNQPSSLASGDFNGDNKTDLVTANLTGGGVSVLLGDGAGNFPTAQKINLGILATYVVVGEFNTDGKQDLVVTSGASTNVLVILGDGNGNFGAPVTLSGLQGPRPIAVGDLNADTKADIVVGNQSGSDVVVFLGNGSGGFGAGTNYTIEPNARPSSIAVSDVNGDTKPDLIVAEEGQDRIALLAGNGSGGFLAPVMFNVGDAPGGVVIDDFNGDGFRDVVVANRESLSFSLLFGNGSGGFTTAATYAGGQSSSVAAGDFNSDGRIDFATESVNVFNSICVDTPVTPLPALSVSDPSSSEESGSITFSVTLAAASSQTVTVQYYTSGESAVSGVDFQPTTGSLTFLAGETAKNVVVPILNDSINEFAERFSLNLHHPVNAVILKRQGIAAVTDSDPEPSLSLNNLNINEGNSGTTSAEFAVALSSQSGKLVTLNYSTADGTATSGQDYVATSGALIIGAGATTKTVAVAVNGDTVVEPDETLFLNLSNPLHATIADSQGVGTIVNDESQIVVINTNDSGAGSLREAILDANANAGHDTVVFDIPGSGVRTISPLSALPEITDPITIDATTQPGFAGTPIVELNGSSAGGSVDGLVVKAGGSTIKGLVIGRFSRFGIWLFFCDNNTIQGNYIGVDPTGTLGRANMEGILFSASSNNLIGGTTPAARNLVSANSFDGVEVNGSNNLVRGNFIGTNASGTSALPNGTNGLEIMNSGAGSTNNLIGGTLPGARNLISGNPTGIRVNAPGNSIQGNLIGTDITGTQKLANGGGINATAANTLIGGTIPDARNIISGNNGPGVAFGGSGSRLQGNFIGTDITGTITLGNSGSGVVAGDSALIGGTSADTRNVISGNGGFGNISLGSNNSGASATVQGNYIGTDVTGSVALTNPSAGISISSSSNLIGGLTPGAQNIISGNRSGIDVGGSIAPGPTGNTIQGNIIGLNAAGTAALPNLLGGIRISDSSNNLIGSGISIGATNVIKANGGPGVIIFSGTGNAVRRNSIDGNGGLGIDLGPVGITANDPADGDSGANSLLNFPLLTQVTSTASSTAIQGTLNSAPNLGFLVDFYSSAGCDASGNGEGAQFLGTTPVTTDGSGNGVFSASLPVPLSPGSVVTATAIDSLGNTSEFSPCQANQTPFISFSQSNYSVGESGGSVTITVNRINSLSDPVTVDYGTVEGGAVPCPTINGLANDRCDYTTALGTLLFAPGESTKTFTVLISQDNYLEGPESVTLTLSNVTGDAVLGTPSTATLVITDDPSEPATNPIDTADAFVRQHYHDFLNREPDAAGLAFWSNQITECQQPGATCNAEVRRINVSAAFFLSIEFQETGYLVYRFYKSAYGNINGTPVPLRFVSEFLPDTQQIGKDVVIGQPGAEQQLEANKVAYALDFVSRSRFTAAYPTTLSPAEFVDALFTNTGVTPSATDRDAAINEFAGAGNTADTAARARALRRVAENSTLKQQETNKAFVLMQYFGYLRRNPNDPPEAGLNFDGYNFWLGKLNEFNGNFVNAEMVKAFIVSGEYRHRFGP